MPLTLPLKLNLFLFLACFVESRGSSDDSWKSKYPAFAGLCLDMLAFVFVTMALFSCLFSSNSGAFVKSGECAPLMDNTVECDDNVCMFKKGDKSGSYQLDDSPWMRTVFLLTVVVFAIDFTSVTLQLLIFWPLVAIRGVFGLILRMCNFLDFCSGWLKFGVAWVMVHKQQAINKSYLDHMQDALRMSLMPSACLQFSLILSFIAFVMLRLATDTGARGEPTHLEIIERICMEEKALRALGSRTSVYKPASAMVIRSSVPTSSTSV